MFRAAILVILCSCHRLGQNLHQKILLGFPCLIALLLPSAPPDLEVDLVVLDAMIHNAFDLKSARDQYALQATFAFLKSYWSLGCSLSDSSASGWADCSPCPSPGGLLECLVGVVTSLLEGGMLVARGDCLPARAFNMLAGAFDDCSSRSLMFAEPNYQNNASGKRR